MFKCQFQASFIFSFNFSNFGIFDVQITPNPEHFKLLFSKKLINAIYWTHEKRSSSLSLYEKGTYLQIGPMEREALRGGLTNHIYSTTLLYKYDYYEKRILQPVTSSADELNQTVETQGWNNKQCHRPSVRWNMRPPRGVREKEDYRQVGRT